jgi:hypothetical protein
MCSDDGTRMRSDDGTRSWRRQKDQELATTEVSGARAKRETFLSDSAILGHGPWTSVAAQDGGKWNRACKVKPSPTTPAHGQTLSH